MTERSERWKRLWQAAREGFIGAFRMYFAPVVWIARMMKRRNGG